MSDSASIPSAEHLVALRHTREAELILLFCDGHLLGTPEMAEIAHILPPAVLANPPAPALAADVDDYAKAIGTSRRTIFRWLDLGRKAKDPCPLDEPANMLGWWARNMRHKLPDYLNDWISRCGSTPVNTVKVAPKKSPSGAGAGAAEPKPVERTAIDMKKLGGFGLEQSVNILRQAAEAAAQQLAQAFNDPNDQQLAHYQSRFMDSVESVRKAEQSLLALQKARGDLAPRSEYRSDLVNLLVGLRGMFRRRADNVCASLANTLTPEQLGTVRALLAAEAARDEKLLRSSKFWIETPSGEIQLPAA